MIVGDSPNSEDIRQNAHFAGYSGKELDHMLAEAGIQRAACFITTAVRSQVDGYCDSLIAIKKKDITSKHRIVNGKYVLPQLEEGVEILKREIELCQPNVIVALGNVALWALTGQWGITNWRSSVIPTILTTSLPYQPKVVPVIPPSMIMKIWSWRQITIHDFRRVKTESEFRNIISLNYKFIIRPNFGQVYAILETLKSEVRKGPLKIAVDVETRSGHMDCIGLAWNEEEALCIPLMHTKDGLHYWSESEELVIVYQLYTLLTHKNCLVIGQNFAYDAQYTYRHWHFIPNLYLDTMTAQHSCFSNMKKSLDFLSSMYSKHHVYWKDEGKEWSSAEKEEDRWTYNCKDCVRTYEVAIELEKVIDQMGMQEVNRFQQSLFLPVLETMDRGIRPDMELRSSFAGELLEELYKREQFFLDVLGYPLNPKSNPQMQGLFYNELKQKPVINRKTKAISCDDEALRKIAAREPILTPLCNKISEYRSLGVFLSTFVNAQLDIDGRIRCMFKTTGTETYRFASTKNAFGSGLNLQNIPKGGEEDSGLELPNVRRMFIPDPGYSFFDIDLDSADLRIVCWEAGIPEMKAMINEGKKVYVEVMKEYYHDPSLTKSSPQYGTFKSFCHGTNYMGTVNGLADRLGLSRHEVDKLTKWYFGKFPELRVWHNKLKDSVIKKKMVENVFGYRQYFFDRIEGTIFNQAVAWIPQSTVACIINRGYRNIYDNLKEVQVLLQVHDSLAGQFPSDRKDYYIQRIIEECSITLPYPDPMVIPVGIKASEKSWGEC